MTIANKLHENALQKLTELRESMDQLMSMVPDEVACIVMDASIDAFELELQEFGLHHFGIRFNYEDD